MDVCPSALRFSPCGANPLAQPGPSSATVFAAGMVEQAIPLSLGEPFGDRDEGGAQGEDDDTQDRTFGWMVHVPDSAYTDAV
jgi:hypothetical protein